MHARIPEFSLRRRFWERVIDGPIGALVLAGRKDEAETALKRNCRSVAHSPARTRTARSRAASRWSAPGRAIRICSRSRRCARCRMPTSCSTTNWCRRKFSIARAAMRRACRSAAASASPASGRMRSTLLIEAAKSGQRAVRLKGGDPFIFGRGGEEVEALREAGVAYSVMPGHYGGARRGCGVRGAADFRHEALRVTFPHRAQGARRRRRRLVGADRLEDDRRGLHGHDGGAGDPRRPAGRRPFAATRRSACSRAPPARMSRRRSAFSNELPSLVQQVDGGPAILVIGDVVAHSAPWLQSIRNQLLSKLLDAAE